MLTKLRLENFKSWRELELDLSNLTFLFGTNSSGKTSILQALLLLKQTAKGFDRNLAMNLGGTEQDYVDFGSYRDLVFRHDLARPIHASLEWAPYVPFEPPSEFPQSAQYLVQWATDGREVRVKQIVYHLDFADKGMNTLEVSISDDDRYWLEFPPMEVSVENCYLLWPVSIAGPITEDYSRALDDIGAANKEFSRFVDSLAYLGPLRSHPQRTYPFRGAEPTDIGPRGEKTIEWLLSAARKDDNRVQQVAHWLKNIGLASELRIDPIDSDGRFYEPRIRIKSGEVENALLDVGFGVSQVLPIVTLLFAVPEGSIVLIEQPELHLHPSAQAGLADLFLEVAEKRNIQLIVESHSEHILARVQRRVAEQTNALATPEHIRMYFCDIENGESKAEPVKLNRFGQVENWPKDFFGDISADLDKMMESGLARRRRELAQQKD